MNIFEKVKKQFVVMDKHCTTVIKSPGLNTPYTTTNFQLAEQVASETGGVVVPFMEAIKLIVTSPCNFPKDSKHYDPNPAARKIDIGLNPDEFVTQKRLV